MKPIKLTMTAFGPYRATEVVDFRELQEHDLFVISGKTGAGKTTIFDGISFALYGSASGQDRGDTKMLRSDFASDDVHTAVELEFELKGKRYRIRRQLGHVKKGNKSRTGDDISFFELLGEKEIPCVDRQIVSEVNQRVEELMGLTADQFKQIVMLPQGEFRKLLTSDTENKEAILRRLFKTENYKAINEVLKRKRDEAQLEYEKQLQLRNEYIQSIPATLPLREEAALAGLLEADYPNVTQVAAALEEEFDYYEEKIKHDEENYRRAYDLWNQRQREFHEAEHLNARFQELENKQRQLKELGEKKEEFAEKEERLKAAERANSLLMYETQLTQAKNEEAQAVKNLEQAEQQFHHAQNSLDVAEANFSQEEKRKSEREDTASELKELEKFLPIVQGIEETKQEIKKIEEKGIQTKRKLEETEKKLTDTVKQQEQHRNELAQLDAEIEKYSDAEVRYHQLKDQVKRFHQYKDVKKEVKKFEKTAATISASYETLKKDYELMEASWLNNQALVLAGHLHDGKPCPVCGSLEHPNVAIATEEAVTREELQQTKDAYLKKEDEFNKVRIALEARKQQLHSLLVEIEEFASGKDLSSYYEQLVIDGNKAKKEKQILSQAKDKRKVIKEEENRVAEAKNELEPLVNRLKDEHYHLRQEYRTKCAVRDERLREIPQSLTELQKLEEQIQRITEKKEKLEKAWEMVQRELERAKQAFTKTETTVQQIQKQLQMASDKRKDAQEVFHLKLREENFADETAYIQAKLPHEKQKVLKAEIETYKQQLHLLTKQTEELSVSLKDKKPKDLEMLKAEVESLQKQYEEALKQLQDARNFQQHATSRKEQILQAEEELMRKEKLVAVVKDVHDMLRGQNAKKISFERYLQMEYLEQIIHAANSRLQKLSNNQYYLTRSDRQESHGKQSGLALDVYDNHTGQTRDVKSLSGGEKFHAALSLALGMSDVIQSFQGNIAIDTMFIDEGFGSLDEEALAKAVDALVELMESGRMIGVISHVKELKEIFPAILEVKKRKEGHSETAFVLK